MDKIKLKFEKKIDHFEFIKDDPDIIQENGWIKKENGYCKKIPGTHSYLEILFSNLIINIVTYDREINEFISEPLKNIKLITELYKNEIVKIIFEEKEK